MKKRIIALRLTDTEAKRLDKVMKSKNPYAPSITQILRRGLEWSLNEIEGKPLTYKRLSRYESL